MQTQRMEANDLIMCINLMHSIEQHTATYRQLLDAFELLIQLGRQPANGVAHNVARGTRVLGQVRLQCLTLLWSGICGVRLK